MVLLANLGDSLASRLAQRLSAAGVTSSRARRSLQADGILRSAGPHCVALVGLSLDDWRSDVALIRRLRSGAGIPVVAVAMKGCEAMAVEAFRAGAANYLSAPEDDEIWEELAEHAPLRDGHSQSEDEPTLIGGDDLVGRCKQIERLRSVVARLARSESNVLITGETGTGKEVVAELIHRNSERSAGPMVSLNCAAVPDALLESELFGHERGAFTGAHSSSAGQLEQAAGGTVFLDEIGELSVHAQAKLLRVLDRKELYRLGGRRRVRVDARVVAATNRDLDSLAQTNEFRRDLYYRLNVGRIHLPPLRARRTDIQILAARLLRDLGRPAVRLTAEVHQAFANYAWPGNVRELRNVLESSLIVRPNDSAIEFADLPDWFKHHLELQRVEPSAEYERIVAALEQTHWNKSHAAKALNWSRTTLYRKLEKHRLL